MTIALKGIDAGELKGAEYNVYPAPKYPGTTLKVKYFVEISEGGMVIDTVPVMDDNLGSEIIIYQGLFFEKKKG